MDFGRSCYAFSSCIYVVVAYGFDIKLNPYTGHTSFFPLRQFGLKVLVCRTVRRLQRIRVRYQATGTVKGRRRSSQQRMQL